MNTEVNLIEQMIAEARRNQQQEHRKEAEKLAKRVKRLIGKRLYAALEIAGSEYTGYLEFEVRDRVFEIDYATPYHLRIGPKGASTWNCSVVTDADELMIFIDNNTRRDA